MCEVTDDTMESANFHVYEFLVSVVQQSIHKTAWGHDLQNVCFNAYKKLPEEALYGEPLYDETQLLMHQEMWDRIVRNKQGMPKANNFILYCKKANASREAWDGNCYTAFALDLLTTCLTPKQHAQRKFTINYSYITNAQQSWINSVVKKNMGHIMVPRYIWQHGIPDIMLLPPDAEELTKVRLLQMVQQFLTWHASILFSVTEYEKHSAMEIERIISAKEEKEWHCGGHEQSRKRSYPETSPTEQQSERIYRRVLQAKLPKFRGKVLHLPRS